MLKFLGRGSAFADEHNSAFFYHNDDLILIDCPESEFRKVKKIELKAVKNGNILNAESNAISRPGPRLKDAAIELYNFINGINTEEKPAA